MALNRLSPGVDVNEVDLSAFVPSVGSSTGGFVGKFMWGPVYDPTIITDTNDLVKIFGKPTDDNYVDWYSVANFLAYTNECVVVRATGYNQTSSTAFNAATIQLSQNQQNSGLTINNDKDFEANLGSSAFSNVYFAARYPGKLGNSLKVIVVDKKSWDGLSVNYKSMFEGAPGTSDYAKNVGASDDEVHILVIDEDGLFTGTPGTILEKYSYLSKAIDAKGLDGSVLYFGSVINSNSKYIRHLGNEFATTYHYVTSVTVDSTVGGTGYVVGDVITMTMPANGGIPAKAKVNQVDAQGKITGVEVIDEGVGYQANESVHAASIMSTNGNGADLTKITAVISQTATSQWGTQALNQVTGIPSKFASIASPFNKSFVGGDDGSDPDAGDLQKGWDIFKNTEDIDVSLLFVGEAGGDLNHTSVVKYVIDNIVEHRRDCMLFYSPKRSDVVGKPQEQAIENIIKTRHDVATNSSYIAMDCNWKLQYDMFNDKYRWLPCNPDTAGLCAQTDYFFDPWWSPAGFNRGRIKNAITIAFNPNQAYRDELYKNNINPIVSFKGEGIILYGDRTQQSKASAFQYINVRRLFLVLEKAISKAAKYQLFEFNDQFTRSQFKNMVEPFLREVRGRRGIVDYMILCDETNNTPEIVDRGQFIASIFIKPSRSINFITLNFVATKSGVNFNEVVSGGF